jgi:hypothetical protein
MKWKYVLFIYIAMTICFFIIIGVLEGSYNCNEWSDKACMVYFIDCIASAPIALWLGYSPKKKQIHNS